MDVADEMGAIGIMAEWLRRQTRNLVGSALVGSNPADVAAPFALSLVLPFAPRAATRVPKRCRYHASIVQG